MLTFSSFFNMFSECVKILNILFVDCSVIIIKKLNILSKLLRVIFIKITTIFFKLKQSCFYKLFTSIIFKYLN